MAANSTAATPIKKKIARLKREIDRIDGFFYTNSPDDVDLAWTLELKRDDMVRAIVLQLHTSTEGQARRAPRRMPQMRPQGPLQRPQAHREIRPQGKHDEVEGTA